MTEKKQEPITMTEKQVFEMFHKILKAGTYPGSIVVEVANACIFCERIAQAPELSPLTPSAG